MVNFQFPMSFIDRGAKFVVWRSDFAAVAAAAITIVSIVITCRKAPNAVENGVQRRSLLLLSGDND